MSENEIDMFGERNAFVAGYFFSDWQHDLVPWELVSDCVLLCYMPENEIDRFGRHGTRLYLTSWFTAKKKKKRPEHMPEKIPGYCRDKLCHQIEEMYPSRLVKVSSPLFDRNLAAGFKNEKKLLEPTSGC